MTSSTSSTTAHRCGATWSLTRSRRPGACDWLPVPANPAARATAYLTGTSKVQKFTALASGGNRESDTTYGHNSYGLVDLGRVSTRRTTTTAPQARRNGRGHLHADRLRAEHQHQPHGPALRSGRHRRHPGRLPDHLLGLRRARPNWSPTPGTTTTASTTLGAAPSAGNLTETTKATSYSGSATEQFTTESAGRLRRVRPGHVATNADGDTTTTTYTPATAPSRPRSR